MSCNAVSLLPENTPVILDEMIYIRGLLQNDNGGRGSGWACRRSKIGQDLKIVEAKYQVYGSFSTTQNMV